MHTTYEPYSYFDVTQEEYDQCPINNTMVFFGGIRVLGTQEPYVALSAKLVPSHPPVNNEPPPPQE
jgi:hypothetical protein